MSNGIIITMTFVMDTETEQFIRQTSVERVINTSMRLVSKSDDEDSSGNYEDWEEFKPIVRSVVEAVKNELMTRLFYLDGKEFQRVSSYSVRKGDI